jgi:hypothetical protein
MARIGETETEVEPTFPEVIGYRAKASGLRKLGWTQQLDFVDESGCDERIRFDKTGWSPLCVDPVQVSKLHRGKRYRYLQRIFKMAFSLGSSRAQLIALRLGFSPRNASDAANHTEPSSQFIAMDNASSHRSDTPVSWARGRTPCF